MSTSSRDRFSRAIAAIVDTIVRPLITYRTAYPCRVVGQNGDGSLELVPDAPTLAGLSAIPIRGLPGVTVKVKPGARVLLEFEGGDRRRPVATLFETSSLDSLTITAETKVVVDAPSVALANGDQLGIARGGDVVQVVLDAIAVGQILSAGSGFPCTLAPTAATGLVLAGQILTSSDQATSG